MFNIDRYDPNEHKRKFKEEGRGKSYDKKKARRADKEDTGEKSTLHVIADEASAPHSQKIHAEQKLSLRTAEEAFNDLDLFEELIEGAALFAAESEVREKKSSVDGRDQQYFNFKQSYFRIKYQSDGGPRSQRQGSHTVSKRSVGVSKRSVGSENAIA